MNILKKTFIFAMPAMIAGCDDTRDYVITDKDVDAKEIVFHDLGDKDNLHIMTFDFDACPLDSILFKHLSAGDTISGSGELMGMPLMEHYWGSNQRTNRIRRVNGIYYWDWAKDKEKAARLANDKRIVREKVNQIRTRHNQK